MGRVVPQAIETNQTERNCISPDEYVSLLRSLLLFYVGTVVFCIGSSWTRLETIYWSWVITSLQLLCLVPNLTAANRACTSPSKKFTSWLSTNSIMNCLCIVKKRQNWLIRVSMSAFHYLTELSVLSLLLYF